MADVEVLEKSELVIAAKKDGLDKIGIEASRIVAILDKFDEPYTSALAVINHARDINVTSEDQKDEIEQASIARKELKKIRCDVENARKELKEQPLREGQAIDLMARIIKDTIVPEELRLEEQEKIVERAAAKRFAEKLEARRAQLAKYTDQPAMYKFENIDDTAFEELLASLKEAQESKVAAEKKAEEDRIAAEKAAAIEQERVRRENEKLKAEAAAREEQLAKEREAEAKRLADERAKRDEELAAERAKAAEEREKREALEAEQRAKAEAEAKAKAEAEENQRQSLLAPDKEKLLKFADFIDEIKAPNVADREAGKVLDETKDFLARISKNLRAKAKQL